jgi:hypothetical protein
MACPLVSVSYRPPTLSPLPRNCNHARASLPGQVAFVGLEGAWGLAFFAVLVPVLSATPQSDSALASLWHEDFRDTWDMLKSR